MNADSKQKIVVKPTMGKIPKTTPKAIVSDSFSGVIPCLRNPKIGTQSLYFKYFFVFSSKIAKNVFTFSFIPKNVCFHLTGKDFKIP